MFSACSDQTRDDDGMWQHQTMINDVPRISWWKRGKKRTQEDLGGRKEWWWWEEKRRVVTHRKERAMDHGTRRQWKRQRGNERASDRNGYEEAERERQTERKKQMDIEKSQSEISHLVPAF